MLALALLAGLVITYIHSNGVVYQKNARILALQTTNYATVFAKYMHNNKNALINQAATTAVFLSPQSIKASWPPDLAMVNLYRQTPCLAIVMNPNSQNLEAVMYYVGVNSNITQKSLQIVRDGSILLGGKGGILINGVISGNSGWSINSSSPFLSRASQCGGALINNSLAVNIDLFLDWNQDLEPVDSILRGIDTTTGLLSLPGHIKNANTLKANLYFAPNKGVILDNSNPSNPTKLSILYNGSGTGTPTIGLGNSSVSTLIGDTFQPTRQFQAGEMCNQDEVGKIVADSGMNNTEAQYLSRSTLVCTQNNMLCGDGGYCYLSSIANNIVFQNNTSGVQDSSGNFYCPTEVPFAISTLPNAVSTPIIATLSGYSVAIGYTLNVAGASITQVTCSNMPVYQY
jgi:hypothetical protein